MAGVTILSSSKWKAKWKTRAKSWTVALRLLRGMSGYAQGSEKSRKQSFKLARILIEVVELVGCTRNCFHRFLLVIGRRVR